MSWIPSYNMLEDCPQYAPGVKMSVDITSASEKINDEWFCFDDRVVHRVQIHWEYNVNLVVYRRNDTPAFMPSVDLSGIPHLQKSVVLNWKNSSGEANANKNTNSPSSQRPPLITPSSSDGNV